MIRAAVLVLVLVFVLDPPARAQEPAPSDPSIPGVVSLRFEARHPKSGEIGRRMGWTASIRERDPDGIVIEKEPFLAYVPKTSKPDESFGLLVWINPMNQPWFEGRWLPVLDRLRVIAVSPVRAGNEEFVWRRMGLALDAVHNMKERYRIDENRVFIAGASGGGRVASGLGLHFPDVFAGGYYQAGCHWHEALPNPSEPAGVWPAGFGRPEAPRFEKARDESRHVIMAGEKDFNRDHAKAVSEAMAKARFRHVLYQEIPDLGHATAPADAFEKGLLFLLQRRVPGEEPKPGKPKEKKEKEPKK